MELGKGWQMEWRPPIIGQAIRPIRYQIETTLVRIDGVCLSAILLQSLSVRLCLLNRHQQAGRAEQRLEGRAWPLSLRRTPPTRQSERAP